MKHLVKKNQKDIFPMMSMFDNFLNTFYEENGEHDNVKMPAVDIIEYDKNYEVKTNLPGFKKKDVKLLINENELIIEAKHEEKKEEKKASYYKYERYSGNYRRSIALTETCDIDNIDAKFEDGVLTLTIPKKEPVPAKEIKIK